VRYLGSTPVGNGTIVVANVRTCNKHSQIAYLSSYERPLQVDATPSHCWELTTQLPLQLVLPGGQLLRGLQWPCSQVWPGWHFFPHPPQLCSSLLWSCRFRAHATSELTEHAWVTVTQVSMIDIPCQCNEYRRCTECTCQLPPPPARRSSAVSARVSHQVW
jgi:hypothetical protein